MSAAVFSSVASALFDALLAGVWLAAMSRVLERLPEGVVYPAWMRLSAFFAAALLAASAVVSTLQAVELSVVLRLAGAMAMLAGVAGLSLAHRRLPFGKSDRDKLDSATQEPIGSAAAATGAFDASLLVASPTVEGASNKPGDQTGWPLPLTRSHDEIGQIAASGLPIAPAPGDPVPLQTIRLFESALAGSSITISQQDNDLRYTRIYNPLPGLQASIGGTDEEVQPGDTMGEVHRLKRKVLENHQAIDTEIQVPFDGRRRWFKLRLEPSEDALGGGLVCVAVDITAEKESEQHLRSLLRELTHRSRNLLAVIQGIARRTAAGSHTIDGFVDRFGGRLQALAAAHDILIDSAWRGAPLRELVQVQMAQIGPTGQTQLFVEGQPLTLKPEAAQHLSLALHELAANAVEHGALSTPAGNVRLTWISLEPPDHPSDGIELTWREEGGPRVGQPERSGFGQIVLDRLVPRGLDGEATLEFLPEGVVWRLNFPRTNLLEADAA